MNFLSRIVQMFAVGAQGLRLSRLLMIFVDDKTKVGTNNAPTLVRATGCRL